MFSQTKRRALKIFFLFTSAGLLVQQAGGVTRFAILCCQYCKTKGFRGAVGELLSRAAYLRRDDRKLYQSWINQVERRNRLDPDIVDCRFGIIVFVGIDEVEYLHSFLSFHQELSSMSMHVCVIWRGIQSAGFDRQAYRLSISTESGFSLNLLRKWISANRIDIVAATNVHCRLSMGWLSAVNQEISGTAEVVYSDYDLLDDDGARYQPSFQPDFSPHLVYDPGYLATVAVTATIFSEASCCTANFEPTPEDARGLVLSIVKSAKQIIHIPEVLCHFLQHPVEWRDAEPLSMPYYGPRIEVCDLTSAKSHYPELYAVPQIAPKVSIIIPTRDRAKLLKNCIDSINRHAYTFEYEIVVLDNRSSEREALTYLNQLSANGVAKVLAANFPFNWSALNNYGIKHCDGDVIVLLNNDTEVITGDWLDRLTMLALEENVGVTGPMLLYPDGSIQHAGVVLGYGGFADHLYSGVPVDSVPSPFIDPRKRRNVSACTGACLAFSREIFELVGEFDERLSVAGDLDFCLRCTAAGLYNVYDGATQLFHSESKSRRSGLPGRDQAILRPLLTSYGRDPYYNSNLSLSSKYPLVDLF